MGSMGSAGSVFSTARAFNRLEPIEPIAPTEPTEPKPARSRWVRAVVLSLIGLLAAWSWLFVVSKWGPANRIDILTFKAGLTSRVMRTLLRDGQGTGHHSHTSAMISGIYATPTYFTMTEQSRLAAKYQPDRFAVFYVFEDIHAGELPRTAPTMMLRTDNGQQLLPLDRELLTDSFHHRATIVRFPMTAADGTPLIDASASTLSLVVHDMTAHVEQAMEWKLPIVYPKDLEQADALSLPTLFALLAGLLAVLSPCLLQLTVYYTFALAGVSMQARATDPAVARSRIIRTALCFVAGFTVVFTASGALAGLAGERLQASGFMEELNRPLSIAAGIGILLVGIWMGASTGAPALCRLPLLRTFGSGKRWLETLKMMLLGSAFAVGCSTCFGGALFISLMIYVGSVGSASLGAAALFLFSLGIAIPYLLAAAFLSRALPLVRSFQRVANGLVIACSVVLIFFGVILIADKFHVPSDWMYRLYLGI
jgi:cytochrome c biogenesis protein CcdA